jgi:hypothetical protein
LGGDQSERCSLLFSASRCGLHHFVTEAGGMIFHLVLHRDLAGGEWGADPRSGCRSADPSADQSGRGAVRVARQRLVGLGPAGFLGGFIVFASRRAAPLGASEGVMSR